MTKKTHTKTPVLTAAEMCELDRRATAEYGIPSLLLMENAGRSIAEIILKTHAREILIVCGKGNNGGDGFVVARHLHNHGRRPRIVFLGSREMLKGDPAVHFDIAERMGIPIIPYENDWGPADLVVDAIFGTGLSKAVGEPYASAINEINARRKSGVLVLSVDVPSGLNADTGEVMGAAVKASWTVTLACEKTGLRKGRGPDCAGKIIVGDISMPSALLRS